MRFDKFVAALAFCGLFLVSPVHAQSVEDTDPKRFLDLLINQGFRAEIIERDGGRSPIVRARVEGLQFDVRFYDCQEGTVHCRSYSFGSGFRRESGYELSLVNDWNIRKRFARAYIRNDGAAQLSYDVSINRGVTEAHMVATLNTWASLLPEFARDIGFR